MRLSLGIRNNNPFNIRYDKFTRWQGLKGSNKGFCVFNDMEYGLRAGCILLRTYITKYHLYTVDDIITRFAPPTENNTRDYIRFVCGRLYSCGLDPDTILTIRSDSFLELVSAICMYESWYRISPYEVLNIINKFKL